MPISTWTMLNLPDIGQTESYTTTFGEDSDYTINPPSYMDNGDGTVTDANTGLMWQQGEAGSMNWEDAITCCEGLSLAGYTDWRLPNIKELESITDDSLYNPPIETNYFPEAHTSHYWSSTIFAAGWTTTISRLPTMSAACEQDSDCRFAIFDCRLPI